MIPKSEVGVLSKDSKNVVQLIKSAYNVSCQFTNLNLFFFFMDTIFLNSTYFVTNIFFLFCGFYIKCQYLTEVVLQSNSDPRQSPRHGKSSLHPNMWSWWTSRGERRCLWQCTSRAEGQFKNAVLVTSVWGFNIEMCVLHVTIAVPLSLKFVTMLFCLLVKVHDHEWGLELRLTGKSRPK